MKRRISSSRRVVQGWFRPRRFEQKALARKLLLANAKMQLGPVKAKLAQQLAASIRQKLQASASDSAGKQSSDARVVQLFWSALVRDLEHRPVAFAKGFGAKAEKTFRNVSVRFALDAVGEFNPQNRRFIREQYDILWENSDPPLTGFEMAAIIAAKNKIYQRLGLARGELFRLRLNRIQRRLGKSFDQLVLQRQG